MGKRLAKRQRHPHWHLTLAGLLVLGGIVLSLYVPWRDHRVAPAHPAPIQPASPFRATDAAQLTDTLYTGIDRALAEYGIWPELLTKHRGKNGNQISVGVPADLPLAEANLGISRFVRKLGGEVLGATQRLGQVEIRCGFAGVQTTTFVLSPNAARRRTGNIAIVLDDFGGGGRAIANRFCALQQPLTLAIIPNEGQVRPLVDRARANGHEVLVHLPMEPEGGQDPGPGAIRIDHDDDEISHRVRQALQQVPHARGLSNHMGSKATADARVMHQILSELKARNLIFLDSRTAVHSVGYQLAIDMDLMAFSRDIFIDEIDDVDAVAAKLWDLAGIAARAGQAVGIGHDREQTLSALQQILPRLETRGFHFVRISQLLP